MSNPKIETLNRLLATELGGAEIPRFAWKWSEDLEIGVQVRDRDGRPELEAHCICGLDAPVHRDDCKMVVQKAKTQKILIAPQIFKRWILCRWLAPPSEELWAVGSGSMEDYPKQGAYIPFSSNQTTLALKEGVEPDERLTWLVIHTVRSAKPTLDVIREEKARRELNEQLAVLDIKGNTLERPHHSSKWWEGRARIQDRLTTFGQQPGKKSSTSYPNLNLTPNPKKGLN